MIVHDGDTIKSAPFGFVAREEPVCHAEVDDFENVDLDVVARSIERDEIDRAWRDDVGIGWGKVRAFLKKYDEIYTEYYASRPEN
jgi:hypothetical protein